MADRAAVDCGSNSTRLLVVDAAGESVRRELTITRLGAGVDETGRLDDAALDRTLGALAGYREIWEELGVTPERVRIVATSAVRDASDRDRFLEAVEDATGVRPDILTGEQEAAITFRGAITAVPGLPDGPVALLDVGGGSTELIVGTAADGVVASVSLQLGCVRLAERALPGDPPSVQELAAASREIRARLHEADAAIGRDRLEAAAGNVLVGVAGTVTTLAALHLGLSRYQPDAIHGTAVPADEVRRWTDRLTAMPARERAGLAPVQAGREDVIAAGAMIVAAVVDRYDAATLVASEADSLDGAVAAMG